MKNKFKILGIIALFAIIGFSMAACDSGGDSSSSGGNVSLSGTKWIYTHVGSGTLSFITLLFTSDTTGVYTETNKSGASDSANFTFTLTENTINFSFAFSGGIETGTIDGDQIHINMGGMTLIFYKQ